MKLEFIRNGIFYITWFPVILALGVIFVYDENLSPTELEKQWAWLGLMGIMTSVAILLLMIIRPRAISILPNVVILTLICFGTVEVFWGVGQLLGLCKSNHIYFPLTGTFYNPGPFSGYLAIIFPVILNEAIRFLKSPFIRNYLYTILLVMGCVLLIGMSRAAWLSVIAGVGFVISTHRYVNLINYVNRNRIIVKILVIIVSISLLLFLFFLKEDSANGRLFIWKISITEIPKYDNQTFRTFASLYAEAQEGYFEKGNYSQIEERVASTPDFAFNEYIQLIAENKIDILFIILLLGILLLRLSYQGKCIGLGGGILGFMVFAFFSYPFHIPGLIVTAIGMATAIIIDYVIKMGERKYILVYSIIILAIIFPNVIYGYNLYSKYSKRYEAVIEWSKVRKLYYSGLYSSTVEAYDYIKDMMNWNGDFWFEYGRSLYQLNRTNEAEIALKKALTLSGDPMILNILGLNAQKEKKFKEAERYFYRAINRVPERVYPYYLLVRLYKEKEFYQPEKLYKVAQFILNKKPKVDSKAFRQIQEEVNNILNEDKIQ